MIAAWMLYCTAFGLLIAGAAVLGERVVHDRGGATRRVWALALAGTLFLPVLSMLLRDAPPAADPEGLLLAASPVAGLVMDSVVRMATLDVVLIGLWLVSSCALAVGLALGLAVTWRRRLEWTPREVEGVSVLVSDDVGPAVVGLLRSRIVLPGWALDAAPIDRSMILRHEQEHVVAGDPRLLLFAKLMIVAMPWNPAVWYMARRVRLAIEIDCDGRVMRRGDMDLRSYAELLLAVGHRRTAGAHAVAFSVGRPFLEQRIDRMTSPRTEAPKARRLLFAFGIAATLAAAWAIPQPIRAADVGQAAFSACPMDDTTATSRALLNSAIWST